MSTDYRDTVFLPRTDFPMKADLPKREPELVARWDARRPLRAGCARRRPGRPKFVLHDGPPYANGHLHMGTALNKILKDVVNRSQQMLGKDAPYVPGWDCHGLPIEWQIEQEYRKKGKDKDAVPIVDFRRECREFAQRWIDVQRAEFKRLGVLGDWDDPYTTMNFQRRGRHLPRARQVPARRRALSRQEVGDVVGGREDRAGRGRGRVSRPHQHHDLGALSADRGRAGPNSPVPPWSSGPRRPGPSRPTARSPMAPDIAYRADRGRRGRATAAWARPGERLVIAAERLAEVADTAGILTHRTLAEFDGAALAGSIARHPLRGHADGYGFAVPLLAGDFVTTEQGTGLVHIAPSHGEDDFELGARHGLEVPDTVAEDGTYTEAGAGLRGPPRVQGGRAGDRGADRARRPAGPRHAGPQLPAFLALQGAPDLPRHRAVVHPDGRRRSAARQGAGRDRRHPLRARPRPATACAR